MFDITDTTRDTLTCDSQIFRCFGTKMTFIWRILQTCTITHFISYARRPSWAFLVMRVTLGVILYIKWSPRHVSPFYKICDTRVPFLSSILDIRQSPWAFHRLQRPFWVLYQVWDGNHGPYLV